DEGQDQEARWGARLGHHDLLPAGRRRVRRQAALRSEADRRAPRGEELPAWWARDHLYRRDAVTAGRSYVRASTGHRGVLAEARRRARQDAGASGLERLLLGEARRSG